MISFLKDKKVDFAKIILCIIFVTFVFYPFAQMVLRITADDFNNIISSPSFASAVKNSIKASLITTVISVSLGLILAFCIQRTAIKMKALLSILLIMPMLIPSISHGMGLTVLFGTNGVLKNTLGLTGTIYGFTGIVMGSVLYSYPVAFLMFNDVLKYQDSSPYEAAMVLGIPRHRQIFAITLPYLKKTIISAIFTVFTMVVTDYGIPLMIGGKNTTLAVMMYQEVIGQLDFGKGSVVGLFLLIPAVITFIINAILKTRGKLGYVTKPFELKKNSIKDGFAYFFCFAILGFVFMLFVAFCVVAFTVKYPSNMTFTFKNVEKMFSLRGGDFLMNSLIIATFVSIIGIATSFITAYFTTRMPSKMSSLLHLFSITSLAIPGLVLGLSYSMTFGGTFLYGKMAILILANIMHFFASPYQMMNNCLSKMNENLENVGHTMGISRGRMIMDVIIPQCKATIFEMFSYFFVNSMLTISAVSFLANVNTKPLSLLISQFEGQVLYECAAVVSVLLLLVNVIIKSAVYIINHHTSKKKVS